MPRDEKNSNSYLWLIFTNFMIVQSMIFSLSEVIFCGGDAVFALTKSKSMAKN